MIMEPAASSSAYPVASLPRVVVSGPVDAAHLLTVTGSYSSSGSWANQYRQGSGIQRWAKRSQRS
jgi:hypothetical protein